MFYFTIFSMCGLLTLGVWQVHHEPVVCCAFAAYDSSSQVFYLKRFFQSKKLI